MKLINFGGELSRNAITLHWQTTNEINVDYLELQRSKNNIDWAIINRQKPKGNSTVIDNKYDFTDYDLRDINYYRLKLVDLDGSFTFSRVIRINSNAVSKLEIYPNPAHNQFNLFVDGAKNAVIKIINSNGIEVKTLVNIDSISTVNTRDLRPGLYSVLIFSTGSIRTIKFLKQ